MKKIIQSICLLGLFVTMVISRTDHVSANMGDMGFFGGISEGTRLPKTTELLLKQTGKKNGSTNFNYTEMVFIAGDPYEVSGILTVQSSGSVSDTADVGTYTETYTVKPGKSVGDVTIDRRVVFTVNYRKEGSQIIKDYEISSWREIIKTPDETYTLDSDMSYFGVSVIEDHRPAATYYRGDVSERAVFSTGTGEEAVEVILEVYGSFYGYNCAWSSTETHKLDGLVMRDDWQMQYQVRPSVSVNKTLQYMQNEPLAISFDGNYKEVMQTLSGLEYDIFVKPKQFYEMADNGKSHMDIVNSFEQLIAPDVNYLKGHSAEYDILKLFSMQILEGDPAFYQPNQAITRGQFTTALVKAIKLPIEVVSQKTTTKKNEVIKVLFPDVTKNMDEYPYIIAAYENGLAIGRDNGNFNTHEPLQRQEAITIMIRALGLESIAPAPTPYTLFTDDSEVASWARAALYAAERIGLISPDEDGNIKPLGYVSKAEGAAILNRFIDYMREDLATDYSEHIVYYGG